MPEKDTIFSNPLQTVDFVFDDKVASVFDDMINRSVPGYATIISMIGVLGEKFITEQSNCYDLGCSLGAATVSILQHSGNRNFSMLAVDNSTAMLKKCRENLHKRVLTSGADPSSNKIEPEFICADIDSMEMQNASMVVLNFTLQFIPVEKRDALIRKIFNALNPGGLLVLSEKICFEDPSLDALFIDMHHRFKKQNGYSELEISQKRAAIENVLIPETIASHEQRMASAGFGSFDVWFQCFNFCSLVAIKD